MKRFREGVKLSVLALVASLGLTGCTGKTPPPVVSRPFAGTKLVVGVLGEAALVPSIKAQRGEWSATTGAELVVLDEALSLDAIRARNVDVLLYSGDRMGDLVDVKALAILPDSLVNPPEPADPNASSPSDAVVDTLAYKDILPGYRDQVTRSGKDRMGLPIGGSALVVAFRRSAFESPANQGAAKAAGLNLEPPKTWDEFDALARFFHGRDWDGDGVPESGVALAWGVDAEGVGNSIFLARTAALGWHRDQFTYLFDSETTDPRVTSPPFVETLKAIVALKAAGPPGAEKFDADAARQAFRSGEVALLIDRAEMAGTWSTEGTTVGVTPLPGSSRVYDPSRKIWEESNPPNRPSYLPNGGGWLVGVVASTTKRLAAEDFLKYLASPDSTNRLRAERGFPMLPVRGKQLAQGITNPRSAPGVESRSWDLAVRQTLTAEKVTPSPRLPSTTDYLADLTRARVASMAGEPAETALASLAKAWTERTKGLGLARQTWHHRRTLNGPSTSAEPPGR